MHRPDLSLIPGGKTRISLALWNSMPAVVAAEVLCFGAGVWIYRTRARDNAGRYAFWALAGFLFFGWLSTLFAGGPTNVTAFAWGGLAMGFTVPWG